MSVEKAATREGKEPGVDFQHNVTVPTNPKVFAKVGEFYGFLRQNLPPGTLMTYLNEKEAMFYFVYAMDEAEFKGSCRLDPLIFDEDVIPPDVAKAEADMMLIAFKNKNTSCKTWE